MAGKFEFTRLWPGGGFSMKRSRFSEQQIQPKREISLARLEFVAQRPRRAFPLGQRETALVRRDRSLSLFSSQEAAGPLSADSVEKLSVACVLTL